MPMTTEISYFVTSSSKYQLITGRSTIKLIRASVDNNENIASFSHDNGVTRILLLSKGSSGGGRISDELTPGESGTNDNETSDDCGTSQEVLMIMMNR